MKSPLLAVLIGLAAALLVWLFFAAWPQWLTDAIGAKKLFVTTIFNGVTVAGLYFLVASGFTLVFGLMRNVNLAHGSLFLFGAYIGFTVADATGYWLLGVAAGFLAAAVAGALMQFCVFRRMEGDELRQSLTTIGISIVAADLMLAIWSGNTYQFIPPEWLDGAIRTPIILAVRSDGTPVPMAYPFYRLVVLAAAIVIGVGLWLVLNRTRIGMMIRAGVDDRAMLSSAGVNVHVVFAIVFAIGAGPRRLCRRRRRHGAVDRAGRGRPLSARLAGRGHRRRHGVDHRGRDRRAARRSRRTDRARLFPDLRHRLHLHHHGRGPRVPAAGHHGTDGAVMSLAATTSGFPWLARAGS